MEDLQEEIRNANKENTEVIPKSEDMMHPPRLFCQQRRSKTHHRHASRPVKPRKYSYNPYTINAAPTSHYIPTPRRSNVSFPHPTRQHLLSVMEMEVNQMRMEVQRMRMEVQMARSRQNYLPTHEELYYDALDHYHSNEANQK